MRNTVRFRAAFYGSIQMRVRFTSLLVFLALLVSLFMPAATVSAMDDGDFTPSPTPLPSLAPGDPSWSFLNMPLYADTAVLVEMSHGIRLYEKEPTLTQHMPLVNHLMTAVLALEYLDEQQVITLSQEAAERVDDTSVLTVGGRYTVEYLLFALILENSNAAAFALAEEISGSEANFVATMNNRASSLGMSSTAFTNATGDYDIGQYSNATDLMTLLTYALRNNDYLDYFSQRGTWFNFANEERRQYFTNNFSVAWSVSENTVNGAILSRDDTRFTAAMLLTDDVKNITYAAVISGQNSESSYTNNRILISDVQSLSSRISAAYETSVLAQRDSVYLSDYEIAGQTVNLVFGQTVTYTHPIGNANIESSNMVLNPEEMTLPLSTTDVIGSVEYRLGEGTLIRVNLTSDTVILAQNDTLNYILSVIDANQELVIFISILFCILMLVFLWQTGNRLIRVIYNAWLKRKRRGQRSVSTELTNGQHSTRTLGSALQHRMRSRSGSVPNRIVSRYRKVKNLPDRIREKFEENP